MWEMLPLFEQFEEQSRCFLSIAGVLPALRTSRHESTCYSPYFMLNREVRSPAADIVYVLTDDSVQVSYDDVVMRTAYKR